jgi:hypothetical protein
MDMVNDRKTTAANAPDEVRRAKALHVKIMNKRRQNPHLGKEITDDMDDVSSDESGAEGDEGPSGYLQHHPNEFSTSPAGVPVQPSNSGSSSGMDAGRDPQLQQQQQQSLRSTPHKVRMFDAGDHLEPTNPLMIQMVKLLEQNRQQFTVPFQQQLMEQLSILQRQNAEILDLLKHQKGGHNNQDNKGKKRARIEGEEDHDSSLV